MAKEKQELTWVRLEVSSLPAELQKRIANAQKFAKQAKAEKDAVTMALAKHWIEAKRIEADEEVIMAFSRFGGDEVNVARKKREAKKASAKPSVAW
jgi:hypothetical protein